MRRTIFAGVSLVTLLSVATAYAALTPNETERLQAASAVVSELRTQPDKGIPDDLWSRAECVAVIPGVKKAAFMVGGEYGKGVMSCRTAKGWSAPVFLQLAKGSWGFQVGAEQIDLVMLMMNRRGVEKLLQDKVSIGADASAAAGPVGRHANASTDAKLSAEILAYSRSKGAFIGIDLSGGVLKPDKDADANAYGTKVTAEDVAFARNVAVPVAARGFIRSLGGETRATTGKK